MSNPELCFEQPLWLLLILPALAVTLIPWLRLPKTRRSGFRKKATAVLHCVIPCLLAVVIAGASLTLPAEAQPEEKTAEEEPQEERSVLLLTDGPSSAAFLAEQLPEEIKADVLTPAQAPASLAELNGYEKIILMDLTAETLPTGFTGLLAQYVQDGGSLLLSGGKSTFFTFAGTAVETLSPVSFDYTSAEGDGIALMLVLDCSNSMSGQNGYNSRSGKNGRNNHWNSWGNDDATTEDTAESLSMAKQGAIRSIEALTANDAVGIVSFNSTATLQA